MSSVISDFWLENSDYWFSIGEKRIAVDNEIYNKFCNYDISKENDLGKVIYLDQFTRHFARVVVIPSEDITIKRKMASEIVEKMGMDKLRLISDKEIVWLLMPWKHLHMWESIFTVINDRLDSKSLSEFPCLNRFFMDTYKKAFTAESVAKGVVISSGIKTYNHSLICGAYPELYKDLEVGWRSIQPAANAFPLIQYLKDYVKTPITISLSGGVDSMLMTALLRKNGVDVVAVHIVYGNRAESAEECKFIETYCHKLEVPLYIYSIKWLRREFTERAFYETMTREIRFDVYKSIGRPVLLGHIQDDVIENIWTNLAKGNNLDNLAKFTIETFESGVKIIRPWLKINKTLIYDVAENLGIPYLKNSTPTWSNRGKFRDQFYNDINRQYGGGVNDTILLVAERYKKQSELLDRLLFRKIADSWNPDERTIDITDAIIARLDGDGWLRIFTDICHEKLGKRKPSFASCNDFASRVTRGLKNRMKVDLSRNLTAIVIVNEIGKKETLLLKLSQAVLSD
jgi:tRNA(Ile)-lysidine synthetase-like protein